MRRLLCCLVTGVLLALALPTGPAGAARVRVADPRGDVQVVTFPGTGAGPRVRPKPKAGPDVTALRILHGPETVRLRLKLDALTRPRTGDQLSTELWVLAGRNGKRTPYWITSVYPGQQRGGSSAMGRASDGVRRVCRKALEVRWDFAAGTVVASFPRRCIGSPARIRVGGGVAVAKATTTKRRQVPFDSAVKAGGVLKDFRRVYSPWVTRG